MARPTKKDVLDELVDRATAKIEANAAAVSDLPPAATEASLAENEMNTPLDQALLFDIFTYCENECAARGDGVQYYIYRDNALLSMKHHPYSWERLQGDFGAGNYRVQAKSVTTGSYLKQQRKMVLAPEGETVEPEASSTFSFQEQPAQAQQPSSPTLAETLALLRNLQDDAEAKRSAGTDKLLATIAAITAAASPIITSLIAGRQEKPGIDPMFQMIIENMREQNRMQLEQMNRTVDELRRTAEASKTPKGPDPFEFLGKLQDAEDRGYKRALQMTELVDEKAEKRAIEISTGQEKEKEDQSVTSTIIKHVGPVVAEALFKHQQAQQQPAHGTEAQTPRPQAPVLLNPPRSNPGGQAGRPASQVSGQGRPVMPQPQPATPAASDPAEAIKLARIAKEREDMAKTVKSALSSMQNTAPLTGEVPMKEKILHMLTPHIADCLMARTEAEEAAKGCLKILSDAGISKAAALESVTIADLEAQAKRHGLPAFLVVPWFKKLLTALAQAN